MKGNAFRGLLYYESFAKLQGGSDNNIGYGADEHPQNEEQEVPVVIEAHTIVNPR